jgi:hypothetical protein
MSAPIVFVTQSCCPEQDEQYDADVETAVDSARLWFNTTAAATFGPPRSEQLVVFDIDETLLCNIKVPDCLCCHRRPDSPLAP